MMLLSAQRAMSLCDDMLSTLLRMPINTARLLTSGHVPAANPQDAQGRQAEGSIEHRVRECREDRQPQTGAMKVHKQVHTEAMAVGSWEALSHQMKPSWRGISPRLEGEHRVLWYPPRPHRC